jgi:hypothetical protein
MNIADYMLISTYRGHISVLFCLFCPVLYSLSNISDTIILMMLHAEYSEYVTAAMLKRATRHAISAVISSTPHFTIIYH